MSSDEPKFQAVYDRFHDRIRHYLRQLVGETEAEDLTQEVFLKIDKGLEGFQAKSSLSTWVYRIATNTALDKLRSASFRQDRREVSASGEAGEPDAEIADGDALHPRFR
jgi:RNA polymerase sigma-70 factor, ECF subfamily